MMSVHGRALFCSHQTPLTVSSLSLSLSLSHTTVDVQSQPQMEDQWPPGIPTIKTPPHRQPGGKITREIFLDLYLENVSTSFLIHYWRVEVKQSYPSESLKFSYVSACSVET